MEFKTQLGKNGLTEGFIESLKNSFKTYETARISILKSATRSREESEKIAEDICKALGKNYTCKIIGFTILVRKWRKPRVSR